MVSTMLLGRPQSIGEQENSIWTERHYRRLTGMQAYGNHD